MRLIIILISIILSLNYSAHANEASNWLKKEIDVILNAYNNSEISNEMRFLMIEDTINYNFAGTGIAKFVAGDSWSNADTSTKKEYVKLFKRHLALNIASLMQGYSNQKYNLINNKYDSKNKVSLIDMEVISDTGNILVTWRLKKSKDRFYIIDLIVADISLVVTKRSEFNSLFKTVDYKLKDFNEILKNQNELSYEKLLN